MRLWRITRFATLDGKGGTIESGRWHTAPRPVIYAADHPSTALLEVFVHLEIDPEDLPDDYRLIEIDVPDHIAFKYFVDSELPEHWRKTEQLTRRLGDAWLENAGQAMLLMPSAVLPAASIALLNCEHGDFAFVKIVANLPHDFDPRLWKSS